MNRFIAGLALAATAVPAAASNAVSMRFECRHAESASASPGPELAGSWDVVMDVGGVPSFGLLSVGKDGANMAGSLALSAGVVVVRSLRTVGEAVTMIVASAEGDVRFDGSLAADGKRMCGVVNYHGGQKLQMVAQKRTARPTNSVDGRAQAGQAPARR